MATRSTSPPPPDGGDLHNTGPENAKTVEESASDSFTKSLSASVEPLREDQVQNAVKFLSHPKVRGSPIIHRRSFLEKKGLTREEIDEAFRRVPDPSSNITTVEAATDTQAARQTSSTKISQNTQPSSGIVPAMPTVKSYTFQWSHAVLAVGILAASGAGTAVFFKNVVLPRFKAWIRKVVREEEEEESDDKNSLKPKTIDEAVEAAKAAASAAALMAKTSQELLNARTEEGKSLEAFKDLLKVQMEEIKSMGSAIHRMEITREASPSSDKQNHGRHGYASGNGLVDMNSYVDRVDPRTLSMVSKQGNVNGSVDANTSSGRPSSDPVAMESTGAPYSKSYMEIMSMIQRGETPPGIKEINDMPLNPNQLPTNPRTAPRIKPWEAVQQQQRNYSSGGQSQARNDGYPEVLGNGYNPQINDRPSDSSEYSWEQKNIKITEIEPETEKPKAISHGIGSSEWRGRGWVPPRPPPVAMPEAATAIRQPKSTANKPTVGNEQLTTQQPVAPEPSTFTTSEASNSTFTTSEASNTISQTSSYTPNESFGNEQPTNGVGTSGMGNSSTAEAFISNQIEIEEMAVDAVDAI